MGSEWELISLREANVTLIDCDHRTPPASETGYPYVAIPQLRNGRIDLSSVRRISLDHFVDWTRKAKPIAHDVILSRRCNPGETAFVPPGLEFALGQNLVLLRADGTKIYPPFLRWLMRGPDWWEQIRQFLNVGAVFDSLKCADIPNFTMRVPPLPEQRAIAHILGTLDDKIELNRRMNETLEEMARALFTSWFVNFDPVRAKAEGRDTGLPQEIADLFPDSFVDSELGEIPEGWGFGVIQDIADVSTGKRPEARYVDRTAESKVPLWGGNGPMAFVSEALIEYPILLTGRVGTLGVVFRITAPCWPSDNTLVIRSKDDASFEYLFFQLKRIDFKSLDRGSTQPLVTQTDVKSQPLVIPPMKILFHFHTTVQNLYRRSDESHANSNCLSALRDLLLPKLIAGDLRVREMNQLLSETIKC